MRSAAICSFLAAILLLAGCGGGDSAPVTADAGGGPGAPPSPAGAPPPPGAPPSDGAAPMGESPPGDTPPDGGTAPGTPDGYVPPDAALSGTPNGAQPGDGYNPGAEGDPNNPNAPRPRRPKTFEDLLADALHAGNEKEWLRLVRTNLIANPASWSDQLQKNIAWVPGLRRPALGTRFGIGVVYVNAASLPRDFEGSPQPIGSSELTAAMATFGQASSENSGADDGSGSRRRRSKQADGAAPPQSELSTDPNAEQRAGGKALADLTYYTGEFGTKFLDALKARIESGEYGAIYKQAAQSLAAGRPERDPNNPDAALSGEGGQPPGTNDGAGGPASPAAGNVDRLALGVVWVGKTNNRDELDELAQKAGVDLLVTFELMLVPAKNNDFVNNKTRIRIAPARHTGGKKEEPLVSSATLENRVVMQARENEKKEDPLAKEVAKVIEALDQKCKGVAFPPGVSPDAIKRRVAAIVAEKPADPLPALVEARYYVVKGLLPEEDLNNAGMALMGGPNFARMVASAPGAGLGPQIGGALTLPSLLNALHGLNAATGAAKQITTARAPRPDGASPPPEGDGSSPVRKGRGKGKGRPQGQQP